MTPPWIHSNRVRPVEDLQREHPRRVLPFLQGIETVHREQQSQISWNAKNGRSFPSKAIIYVCQILLCLPSEHKPLVISRKTHTILISTEQGMQSEYRHIPNLEQLLHSRDEREVPEAAKRPPCASSKECRLAVGTVGSFSIHETRTQSSSRATHVPKGIESGRSGPTMNRRHSGHRAYSSTPKINSQSREQTRGVKGTTEVRCKDLAHCLLSQGD